MLPACYLPGSSGTEVPPRVEYALSEIGETLRPVIDAMAEWGGKYKDLLK